MPVMRLNPDQDDSEPRSEQFPAYPEAAAQRRRKHAERFAARVDYFLGQILGGLAASGAIKAHLTQADAEELVEQIEETLYWVATQCAKQYGRSVDFYDECHLVDQSEQCANGWHIWCYEYDTETNLCRCDCHDRPASKRT